MDCDGDAVYERLKAMVLQDLLRDPHATVRFTALLGRGREVSPTYRRAIEAALAALHALSR